jgi:5-methyltetrahydrofolate--homocysteine methyltransferase
MSNPNTKTLSILDRLARGEVLISDGATGTYLQNHGLEPGGCPEEFNASHPEVVKGMARAYFEAGSDMVLANSFGGNRFMLSKYGYGDRVGELNRLAAEHARSQAPPDHYVFGSVGPSGEFLEPLGEVTEAEMLDVFMEQIAALKEGGVDGVVVETMTALEEASLAIKAAKQVGDLVVMATMTFDEGPRGFFTMMGVTPEQAVTELEKAGADIVGSNCGSGIEVMVEVGKRLREATDGYLLIHANAGIPAIKGGEIVYPESPDYMVDGFKKLAEMGVNIVSGGCGTNPEHIRALSKALRG